MYRFEKLKVWQDSLELVKIVYDLAKKLPPEEKFALIDQLKRAVTSICLNIAEGTGGMSDKDFANFLRIAQKSLHETVACLKICEKLFGVNPADCLSQCDLVGKQLFGLVKSLKSKVED